MTRAVLLVVSSLSPGGAERVISEIANAWAESGWRIGLLTISNAIGDHYPLSPRVRRIALNLMWNSRGPWDSIASNIRRTRTLRAAVHSFAPDVVLSFIDQTNVRVLCATLGLGLPVIVSERVDPRRHQIGSGWKLARRLFYPHARLVVVQTATVAAWARSLVDENRVRVVPNFVRSMPLPTVQRDPNLILAVGRLASQKGFDLLISAFAATRSALNGTRLAILGEGPERPALERLAARLGVADSVEMPGAVADPEAWMARASLFVLPSRYEGFPNALLEAMAMGCAVIAADCESGPGEIVRNGVDGVLIPPEDEHALAAAIVELHQDLTLRDRLGREALEVRNRFEKEAVISKWTALIQEATVC